MAEGVGLTLRVGTCRRKSPGRGWRCSRERRHSGRHVAVFTEWMWKYGVKYIKPGRAWWADRTKGRHE